MIVGIGTDLALIERFSENLEKLGSRLVDKHFSPHEQTIFHSLDNSKKASYVAKRFAAKEAVAKALKTGIQNDVYLKDIEIRNNDLGAPYVELYNGSLKQLAKSCPKGYQGNVHISISDDGDYAQAFALIEAIKDDTHT